MSNCDQTTKKVLCLSPQDVYPPTNGGKRGIYFAATHLAKQCQLTFAFFHSLTPEALEVQTAHFSAQNIKCLPINLDRRDSLKQFFISLCRLRPIKFSKYHQWHVLNQLTSHIQKESIDIIVIHHAHLGWYARKLKALFPEKRIILREHNIEYELVRQYTHFQKNILIKALYYLQYQLSKFDEQSTWKKVDTSVFISDSDLGIAKSSGKLPDDRWKIAYDGITFESYKRDSNGRANFLYAGALKLMQNAVMMKHFVHHYWIPFTETSVYSGQSLDFTSNDENDLCHYLALSKDDLIKYRINALGFVPDFQEAITNHQFFLSPTNFGSGIRVKVIEAMSQGALVMVTDIDYHMCHFFKHQENILHYNTFQEFVENIAFIQSNPLKETDIRVRAFADAQQYFNWKILTKLILNP